jgi:hypothetical protein
VSQGEVWGHVGEVLQKSEAISPSAAYHDAFSKSKSDIDS